MRKFIIRLLQWEVGVGDVELGVARHNDRKLYRHGHWYAFVFTHGHLPNACVSIGLDICNPAVDESQSRHRASMETAESVATRHKPHPAVTKRLVRLRRRPARFLETIQARRLINRNSTARAHCHTACCDVTTASSCQSGCSARAVKTYSVVDHSLLLPKVACVRSVVNMPRRSFLQPECDASDSESSESGSGFVWPSTVA